MSVDALVAAAAQQATSQRSVLLLGIRPAHRRWTPEETEYLKANLGIKPVSEIAVALGRSEAAVKIRWTRCGLTAPGKHKDYYCRREVADMLGIDVHAVMQLERRGLLKFERVPGRRVGNGNDKRRIHSSKLRRFVIDPNNFIYFLYNLHKRRKQIPHAGYARLIDLAHARWGDEWWSPGQYQKYHGVCKGLLHQRIARGKLSGIKWGNWWVRKSEAIADQVRPGKGSAKKKETQDGN